MVFLRPLETMVSRPLHGRMTSNKTLVILDYPGDGVGDIPW